MRLLIVGSLSGHIAEAGKIARDDGAKVTQVDDPETCMKTLRSGKGADLVMVDLEQDISGLIASLEQERFHIPVVACGVESNAEAAVSAIKAGAKEYIPLPPNAELIAGVLAAVTEEANSFLYADEKMKAVLTMAEQIAPSEAGVLITGESGTGKEVMARFLHNKSKRATQNFVAVNCAAIPDNLLESELFGHEKGAFTGAVARRIGKFEEADGGTLLLDEISEMDLRLQAKLLRVIQEQEVDRVGGSQPIKVNIRLLATSNRNLQETVKNGDFREDLYFRLNVVNVNMPSLRERPKDIALLAAHFVKKYADVNGVPQRELTKDALAKLEKHHWAGNVRELENTMHRAVLMAQGAEIDDKAILLTDVVEGGADATAASSAGDAGNGDANGALVGRTVAAVERDLIIDTLKHCLGNRTHAANILGISIRTLRNKLNQYTEDGVDIPGGRQSG